MKVSDAEIRRVWLDPGLSRQAAADEVGLNLSTLKHHARRLGLTGDRNPGGAGKRRRTRDRAALTGGEWVSDKRGIKRWVPTRKSA